MLITGADAEHARDSESSAAPSPRAAATNGPAAAATATTAALTTKACCCTPYTEAFIRHRRQRLPCKKLYEYESFEELKNEVERQGRYFLHWHMTVTNLCEIVFAENFPAIVASAMQDGCMERGLDVTLGGALYNQSSFCAMGTANMADGLMAVKKLCFDEKRYTLRYFYDALCANWEGYEELRQIIRNECPHYGNGIEEVDRLAEWSLRYYAEHLNAHDCARGGKFCGGTFTVTMHVFQGLTTPATPDGRYAGAPLADAISPVQGLDLNGPSPT
jgi:formate C-acetyltransferase